MAKEKSQLHHSEARLLKIPAVETPPWIDGKLDEKIWQKAASFHDLLDITGYLEHRYNVSARNPAGFDAEPELLQALPTTRVLLCHDAAYLYVGFICEDPHPEQIRRRQRQYSDLVEREDCVYVWLDPGMEHIAPRTCRYVANAAGQKSENLFGKIPGDYASLMAWEARVSIEKSRWSAEMMIPLERLGLDAKEKNVFGLNLGRGFRGDWRTHSLVKPDGYCMTGWGFGLLLDKEEANISDGVKKINNALDELERRRSGRALATEPGFVGNEAGVRRDSNAMLGISVWGPDYQPTISVGRADCYDRRWYGNEGPAVTRREVIEAAMSGDGARLARLWRKSCNLQYTAYPQFPAPKTVGQIIFFLPEGKDAGWRTEISSGEDGAINLSSTCARGEVKLHIYVHKKRNLIVVEGTQKGLDNEALSIRLYRHNDNPPPKKLEGYDYDADIRAGKNVGTLSPPKAGVKDNLIWLKQEFAAEATFPDGFEVLLAAALPGSKTTGAEIKINETGLGSAAKSPYEGWKDPATGHAWRATAYERQNAAPGSAVTLSVKLKGRNFRALFPVVSTNDGADTLETAQEILHKAANLSAEELEAGSRLATRAERLGTKYVFQQDLALSSIFSSKFCFSDKTDWHGDYHFNEWGGAYYDYFIEGRTDELETYFQMVETNLPAARALAREAFGCGGAAWPVASFPMRFERLPMTNLDWDYSIECTGLVIQPFWLTYQYTINRDFLKERAYPVIKEAALFYADYVTLEDDGLYHIFPCTSSEHVPLQPYLKYNRDSNAALSMVKFILGGAIDGAEALGIDKDLVQSWKNILKRLAPYPVEETPEGPRFVDVAGARLMTEYNIFSPLFAVFFGNDIGLASNEKEIAKAKRSLKGLLRLSTGHWGHVYRAMTRLGIYPGGKVGTENLIQSHQGPIFLFPAAPENFTGQFKDYHARGGFMVSAKMAKGKVKEVKIHSRAGMKCMLDVSKGFDKAPEVRDLEDNKMIETKIEKGRYLSFETDTGKTYDFLL